VKNINLVEKFKDLGFKEYEAKILIILLSGKLLSASEIAREGKMVRTSIYDTLKSFVERGYINEIETSSILKYQIINPEVITDKAIRELNELNSKMITQFRETFSSASIEIGYGKHKDKPEDNIELIRGYNKHRVTRYIELVRSAEKQILGMNRINGVVTDELSKLGNNLVNNGGEVRYIYKIDLNFKIRKNGKVIVAAKEDLVNICRNFESTGEKIRLTMQDIPNAAIFDSKIAFINITSNLPNTKNRHSDLIIKNSDFVNNLKDMFEFYWQNSISIEDYAKNN
jgi:sugar-specific transcriptional regulator TrmB